MEHLLQKPQALLVFGDAETIAFAALWAETLCGTAKGLRVKLQCKPCVFMCICVYIYISLDFSFEQCAFSHRVIYLEPIAEHNSCYSSSRSGPSSFDIVRW